MRVAKIVLAVTEAVIVVLFLTDIINGMACVVPVPIDRTAGINMLYVFVDIKIDSLHFVETLQHNFTTGTHLALVSTIQFVPTLQVP